MRYCNTDRSNYSSELTDFLLDIINRLPKTKEVILQSQQQRNWLGNEDFRNVLCVIWKDNISLSDNTDSQYVQIHHFLDQMIAQLLLHSILLHSNHPIMHFSNLISILKKYDVAHEILTFSGKEFDIEFISQVLLHADRYKLVSKHNIKDLFYYLGENSQLFRQVVSFFCNAFGSYSTIPKEGWYIILDVVLSNQLEELENILHQLQVFNELSAQKLNIFLKEYLENKNKTGFTPSRFLEDYSNAIFDFDVFDLTPEDHKRLQEKQAFAWRLLEAGVPRDHVLACVRLEFSTASDNMTGDAGMLLPFLFQHLPSKFFYIAVLNGMNLINELAEEFENLNMLSKASNVFVNNILSTVILADDPHLSFEKALRETEGLLHWYIARLREFDFVGLSDESQALFIENRDKVYKVCREISFSALCALSLKEQKDWLVKMDSMDGLTRDRGSLPHFSHLFPSPRRMEIETPLEEPFERSPSPPP